MEDSKTKIRTASSSSINTSFMRNYLGSVKLYETKTVEYFYGNQCHVSITIWKRGEGRKRPLFSVSFSGTKTMAYELCYSKLRTLLGLDTVFVTQGDNDLVENDIINVDKKENVIIEGAEQTENVNSVPQRQLDLIAMSSSEPLYDFQKGAGSVMNRWFPLESIKVTTNNTPETDGGLLKSWVLPQDLVNSNFDAINVLPMRGFMLGRYAMEFKMLVQTNPFQACCIMLSTSPYSYGLVTSSSSVSGLRQYQKQARTDNLYLERGQKFTYFDYQVAVQRPHIILDVSTGGEATLQYKQCFPKTFVRNFDFNQNGFVNPGIRGANCGTLCLHLLSQLRVGTGNENSFNVRVFYRFIEAQMTAMTQTISKDVGLLRDTIPVPMLHSLEYRTKINNANRMDLVSKNRNQITKIIDELKGLRTQGPIASTLRTARGIVDVVDDTVSSLENIGQRNRKGFKSRNRDKPNNPMAVTTVPRVRSCFTSGEGIDDSVVLAIGLNEKTEFFELFEDPVSLQQIVTNYGYMDRFKWPTTSQAGASLWAWNLHPTHNPSMVLNDLQGNRLRSPVEIWSSAFTYYAGTFVLKFQFVKTQYHKGAVEIAINFGKQQERALLSSSYVKVLNVQEVNEFEITVPYIYDTPSRLISGTVTPFTIPSLSSCEMYALANSATLVVKVINELVAPNSVHKEVEVLVWIKAGPDFSLMFPHAMNTLSIPWDNFGICQNPMDVKKYMKSDKESPSYIYNLLKGTVDTVSLGRDFLVQSDDFGFGPSVGNRITTTDHMNIKTLLKMPVKILSNYYVSKVRKMEVKDVLSGIDETYEIKNYCFIPVTVLNSTLISWLSSQNVNSGANMLIPLNQSIQNQITSMFSMFRGSITFTVVLVGGDMAYVQYLPHDYKLRSLQAGIMEKYQVAKFEDSEKLTGIPCYMAGFNDNKGSVDLAFGGCYTTLMCKKVNPTEKFEIPMGTQVNWLMLNRQLATDQKTGIYTMRENSEWFNGHLAVWGNNDITIDVYANCSDDFELAGYLGHMGVTNPYSAFALSDNWRTQGMDFRLSDLTSQGWTSIKKLLLNLGGATIFGIGALAGPQRLISVTGALSLYCAIGGVTQVVTLRNTLQSGVVTVTGVQEQVADIIETGSNLLFDCIVEHFPWLATSRNIKSSLWTIGQNMIHALLAKSWTNCAFSAFNILLETQLFDTNDWVQMKDHFEEFFKKYIGNKFTTQGVDDHWHSMMEILVTVVVSKLQIKSAGGIKHYLTEIFRWQNYNNIRGLSSVLGLLRTFMKSVSCIIDWAFSRADPNISLIKALSTQDEQLGSFLEESNLYLNSFNDADFKRKDMRVRFLHVILRAFKLRLVLLKIGNPRLTAQLLNVCNKVIEKAQKQKYLFKCDLVKMEPFVVCIEGQSGIGKSFSVYDISSKLLESISFEVQNPDLVFTIPAGVQYWNGYADQPIVWYDDWCNLMDEETMRMHISQLYALKTSAPFNVPRAELENKEQIANPLVVMMTTNVPFPTHAMFTDKEAVYRRRDVVVKFERVPGMEIETLSSSQLDNFEHIQVRFYKNSRDPSSLDNKVYTYNEFMTKLSTQFVEYYHKELDNKQRKYDILMKSVRSMNVDTLNLGNPFELINKVVVDSEDLLTSELLDSEVEHLLFLIKNQVELSTSRVSDEEMFEPQGLKEKYGETKKWCVQRCKDFKEKFMKWRHLMEQKLMVCANCLDTAQVHGTTFWCEEGSHYMCFHCGIMAGACEVPIEDQYGYATNQMMSKNICGIHGKALTIVDKGFVEGFVAEVLFNLVDTPYKLYAYLKALCGGASMPNKALYGCILAWQFYMRFLYRQVVNGMSKMNVQSWSDTVELESFPVSSNFYDSSKKQESVDYQAQFTSKNGEKYICMHSLLNGTFLFEDGVFTIMESGVEIPDIWCKEKCALSNVKFLGLIKTNLQVSSEYIFAYKARKIVVIKKHFPRFLWPVDLVENETRMSQIRKLFTRSWWENYTSSLNPRVNKYLKFLVPLLGACAALWTATKLGKKVWELLQKFFGVNLNVEGKFGEYRDKKPRKTGKTRARSAYSTQANTQNFENKLEKIAGNYIVITGGKVEMTGWGIKGSSFIIPKHLVSKLTGLDCFDLVFPMRDNEKLRILTTNIKVTTFERRDLAIVTIEGTRILFKDCTKFIAPRLIENYEITEGVLMDVDTKTLEVMDVPVRVISGVQGTSATSPDGQEYYTDAGIMYNYERNGLCGSLLCADLEYPIISMHVSGSSSIGKGIGALLERIDFGVQGCDLMPDSGEPTIFFGPDVDFMYEASVPRDMVPYLPKKTNLVPSAISKYFPNPSLMMPAFLDRWEGYPHPLHPFYYGVQKNGKSPLPFREFYISKAFEFVADRVLAGDKIREAKILTEKEAITGLTGFDCYRKEGDDAYYGRMELSTSAGWPFTTARFKEEYGISSNSKKAWVDLKEDELGNVVECTIHPAVLEKIEQDNTMRKNGMPAFNVFQDCLKDEKRKITKAMSEGGTRLFSMSNIAGTIVLRQYTLDLIEHMRYNRLHNSIGVGINPDSLEWTVLAQILKNKGSKIFTTDFSNFGASLMYEVVMKFADLVKKFYKLDDQQFSFVKLLIEELASSRHVSANLIYKTKCGSPSGAAITVEINSFVHLMYVVVAWLIIGNILRQETTACVFIGDARNCYTELRDYIHQNKIQWVSMSVEDLKENVAMVVYGDDGIFSVSDEYCEIFNAVTINLVLKEHRIGVTDATKSDKIIKYTNLSEATFLKRSFVPNELMPHMLYASRIEWNVVEECVRWVHKKPYSLPVATRENCISSLMLAWGHGREKYYEWCEVLNEFLQREGIDPVRLTWEDVAVMFYKNISIN